MLVKASCKSDEIPTPMQKTTKIYFTSDLHFGHENIIRYCGRPFSSATEMDEALISAWNQRVQPDDVVYVLGDLFFCPLRKALHILWRLNGSKRLVYGNHDKLIRREQSLQDLFDRILPDLHEESVDGIRVVMCHYPLLTWNDEWRGAFMLHGHTHGRIALDSPCRRLDVGVDAHGYAPISWSQVRRLLEKVNPNPHA